MPVVPVRFKELGEGLVPLVRFGLKSATAPGARLVGDALVDTGSNVTVVPRDLLDVEGFPVRTYSQTPHGLHGVGGAVATTRLPSARLFLLDADGAYQGINLDTVHVTPIDLPPILGRDALAAFSARLVMDFHQLEGSIVLG